MPALVAAISAAADAAITIVNFFNTGISSIVTVCLSYSTGPGFIRTVRMHVSELTSSPAPCQSGGRSFRPKALRKARLRTRQMFAHGHAGRLGIARDDGIADRPMLGERGAPGFRIFEIMREFCEVGIETLIKEFADDADQDGVVEASCDRDMKRAVMDHRCFAGMLHGGHRLERGIDALDIARSRYPRRLLRDGALDE